MAASELNYVIENQEKCQAGFVGSLRASHPEKVVSSVSVLGADSKNIDFLKKLIPY